MAISVPVAPGATDPGFGNLTFLLIMIALTLLAVVVAVLHPVAWTDEELRFAIGAPVVLGTSCSSCALAAGKLDTRDRTRFAVASRRCSSPSRSALGSLVVAGPVHGRVARSASGRSRRRPPPTTRSGCSTRPARHPRAGSGRARCRAAGRLDGGLPHRPARSSSTSSAYIPWALIENHQLFPGWPPGHTGQTLLDLPGQMYAYHNGLTVGPPRLVAVVGLADEPEARLVLPGGPGRRHVRRAVRRRQPRHLVAGHPGHGLRGLDGVQAPEPRPDPHRRSASPRSGSRGRGSIGPPSSTTTTRRCRSSSWPWPTSWRRSGTAPRATPGRWPGAPAALAIIGPALLWLLRPAVVRVRRRRIRSIPGRRPVRRSSRSSSLTSRTIAARRGRRSSASCSSSGGFLAFQRRRRVRRRAAASSRPPSGRWS